MDALAGHILIVSGSPGSGKTTIAAQLARLAGCKKVHLHSDDFWGYIGTGHVDPWLPEADEQNQMIMQIAAEVAALYARRGYLVALDGVIRPWALDYYENLGVPSHFMVLRTSVDEAVRRCQARGGDSLTDPEIVAELHSQFADLGAYEHHVLPVDGLDQAATLEAVIAGFSSGAHRRR
jgi:predicted kinase